MSWSLEATNAITVRLRRWSKYSRFLLCRGGRNLGYAGIVANPHGWHQNLSLFATSQLPAAQGIAMLTDVAWL